MTKIHIRLGEIEVEYEGEADFLSSGLTTLLEQLHELSARVSKERGSAKTHVEPKPREVGTTALPMTTKTVAQKLSAKSGSELALAAGAQLGILQGQHTFKRSEIQKQMESATGIYTPNMASNLTKSLNRLVKNRKMVEAEAGVYALTPDTEGELRTKLGIS